MVGVSRDAKETSKSFAQELNLPYVLIPDPDGQLGGKLGVPSRAGFYARRTVILSPEGRIAAILEDVDVREHANQVADAIRRAQQGN